MMIAAAVVVAVVTPFGVITFVAIALAGGAGYLASVVLRGGNGRALAGATIVGALLASGLLAWVGANDPTVLWFGHVTTHGDRHGNQVAITFDDGPDDPWSLEVAGILDAHGVKGTFFEVGKAIEARPDIAQALMDDGHLLGNHSYHHNYWGWLDPRYPELQQTQDSFKRNVGKCPAFFRPPHGQRTPFMLARVSDAGMHTVTWDTSASDWTETDGRVVAQRILLHVKPGSIILLHDGLDGDVHADRSVLRAALPLVLDGLQAMGLHPVRLDELLGRPGYLESC
jgi:peptidoglycan/xylan/chitin deacetylase (PgdA/CDA1 family)